MKELCSFLCAASLCLTISAADGQDDFATATAQRVDRLIGAMTLEEKVGQTVMEIRPIPRLGIPGYDWWNECLHGVGRADRATVFPQAIGLAAMWDESLMHELATVISDEARAKHHEFLRQVAPGIAADRPDSLWKVRKFDDWYARCPCPYRYHGLTFWSPNINIFRDPRWGRGQETYGEDPYLTGRTAVAFIRGLQGDDPHYLKLAATAKHFAVHSGPESSRHVFDARISERDLRETYLPAFRMAVQEGKVASVMGAYNRVDGAPACANRRLLDEILRKEWGFDGVVVSDVDAVIDVCQGHHYAKSFEEAAAVALRAGCDLNGGPCYNKLLDAVRQKLVSEAEIDVAVRRNLTLLSRLGIFDPPEKVPYSRIPISVNDSLQHRAVALQAARESIVLLKNENQCLPLKKDLHKIAVIGPNADDAEVLLGNYNGTPSASVTPLAGIRRKVSPATRVDYVRGCDLAKPGIDRKAVDLARDADVVVMVMGISPRLEGEEMPVHVPGFSGGDRTRLELPGSQEELLQAVQATGKPVVLVLLNGSALAISWAQARLPAIVETWYGGEEAGTALADVLFGDYNPAGRLPVTFYKTADDLPPFDDYAMAGRTYRYFAKEVLYPFGYGLSYTKFEYGNLVITPDSTPANKKITVSATVKNVGPRDGEEVAQLYLSAGNTSVPEPIRQLQGFRRIKLKAGETQRVDFTLTPYQLSLVNDRGKRVVEPGEFRISVGGGQTRVKSVAGPQTSDAVEGTLRIVGDAVPIDTIDGLDSGAVKPSASHSPVGLKDAYSGKFLIGAANDLGYLSDSEQANIKANYNVVTPENCMKPQPIHPEEKSYNWSAPDRLVKWCEENHIKVWGHTLCWHGQTGRWFFDPGRDGKPVTRELAMARLKEHISTVVGRYQGRILGWDVVNEAIDDRGAGSSENLRRGNWYRTIGPDYLTLAFKWAHEADPKAKLNYNDYNIEQGAVRGGGKHASSMMLLKRLIQEGAPITGVGIQGHWHLNTNPDDVEKAITDYESLGLKVSISELDVTAAGTNSGALPAGRGRGVTIPPEAFQQQAKVYAKLFAIFKRHAGTIERVTLWGLSDRRSWLSAQRPLLFDAQMQPKPAYQAVLDVGLGKDKQN
jgi:beta-glucosidase